jgi:hypothetical protein
LCHRETARTDTENTKINEDDGTDQKGDADQMG